MTLDIRHRRTGHQETLQAAWAINCSGPESNYFATQDPLLRDLITRGVVRPDPLGLGLDVTEQGAVINNKGSSPAACLPLGRSPAAPSGRSPQFPISASIALVWPRIWLGRATTTSASIRSAVARRTIADAPVDVVAGLLTPGGLLRTLIRAAAHGKRFGAVADREQKSAKYG